MWGFGVDLDPQCERSVFDVERDCIGRHWVVLVPEEITGWRRGGQWVNAKDFFGV